MTIKKHDERLVEVLSAFQGDNFEYKYFLSDLSDTTPLKIPILYFIDKTITTEYNVVRGITAQTLIALNRGDTADNPARYDADKLCIPGSVIKGDDGYYSVDYSKLDFTPTTQRATDIF
mgnify:CR=1 FL=1|tara:strand:- start:626 stop:982 length:357 start_codon:yes stop_codon:yes gene_type:complete